jgi:RimJ/RimL family protein N-acetyltransferase
VDAGALLAATHELSDGTRARLRLARPSDVPRVRGFLEALSPETRRLRFFTPMPSISESTVRHFTFYDPRERLVVAALGSVHGREEIVGLADVSLHETGLGELGIVVSDAFQHKGVGRLLIEAAASLSLRRGATHLKAECLDENTPMLKLMRGLGTTMVEAGQGHVVAHTRLPARHRYAA